MTEDIAFKNSKKVRHLSIQWMRINFFKATIYEVIKIHIPQKNINGRWNVP